MLLLSRDEESLDRAVAELGPAARAVAADMAYPGTAEQVADEVDARVRRPARRPAWSTPGDRRPERRWS